ncbi:hypothetical protein SELMODRAFT_412975 [Selaginella moellendorffii]|uniref:Uncharacterized protein n=1 Tax=Selaginella moellendorffii TaxID=88036 RepID=D8RMY4_SELML|nr:hypothetical protein SELMODRAFT_412975 [Selaginella moellendorffii]
MPWLHRIVPWPFSRVSASLGKGLKTNLIAPLVHETLFFPSFRFYIPQVAQLLKNVDFILFRLCVSGLTVTSFTHASTPSAYLNEYFPGNKPDSLDSLSDKTLASPPHFRSNHVAFLSLCRRLFLNSDAGSLSFSTSPAYLFSDAFKDLKLSRHFPVSLFVQEEQGHWVLVSIKSNIRFTFRMLLKHLAEEGLLQECSILVLHINLTSQAE